MGDMADYSLHGRDDPDDFFWTPRAVTAWGVSKSYSPNGRVCKYCGQKGLHWSNTGDGYRLYLGSQVHTCDKYTKVGE